MMVRLCQWFLLRIQQFLIVVVVIVLPGSAMYGIFIWFNLLY